MLSMEAHLICPACGVKIQLEGTVKEVPSRAEVSPEQVLALFPKDMRKSLKVTVAGNFARVELKGKFSRSKFGKVLAEVKGWGGKYVKGYFSIPVAGIFEKKE